MPKGPRGEKRPADVIGAAILVGRIATGDDEDKPGKAPKRAKGGAAKALTMTPEERSRKRHNRFHPRRSFALKPAYSSSSSSPRENCKPSTHSLVFRVERTCVR